MRDAMCLFLSCCLKETSITSGSCGLCPGWDIGDQYFESRTGHQRCACRTYWCSWLVSANHSKPQCHARMVWVCHSLRKRIPTNYNYNQLVTNSMFCGLLCNVHNSQHSQPIFVHLFVCVCVCFFSRVLFGSANQDESGHGVVHIHVRKDKETFQFSYPRALPGEKLNLVVRSVKKDKFKKKEAGVSVMTSSREALGSFFFLFVCFQWAHIKHVDIAQKNPKESMRTSLETTVERFSPVNSLGRNLPWVTSLGEFTYKFL